MAHTAHTYLENARRIVLKFGSALVSNEDGSTHAERLNAFARDIGSLRDDGKEVIVVSSGAVALGQSFLRMHTPLRLEEKQAAAAAGQPHLMAAWQNALSLSIPSPSGPSPSTLSLAQILLTLEDTEDRRRYLNARATLETLLSLGVVPLINENDTIATSEIRYGDNDRLAAHAAQMIGADLLVLLSDIDGLYDGNPHINANAQHIPLVSSITKEIERYAQGANEQVGKGSGGMITKIAAAKIATGAGIPVLIVDGTKGQPLLEITTIKSRATLFTPSVKASTARRQWIAGRQKPHGLILIDDGAAQAIHNGSSLLPAGVIQVDGSFKRGDLVGIATIEGDMIALGLTTYDAREVTLIKGLQSDAIEQALGYRRRPSVIHRDDLVLTTPEDRTTLNTPICAHEDRDR